GLEISVPWRLALDEQGQRLTLALGSSASLGLPAGDLGAGETLLEMANSHHCPDPAGRHTGERPTISARRRYGSAAGVGSSTGCCRNALSAGRRTTARSTSGLEPGTYAPISIRSTASAYEASRLRAVRATACSSCDVTAPVTRLTDESTSIAG